ncbi:hypothetical protein CERSUDRAFT_71848 [Gelatoporia subvermispora B]|uniref:Uncharacterized protein n=1 Tax=Ceriporiopsis subvermispora (strain B) TaxID=914234 RepID=M2QSN5_CERS8|nr:hypothetical protein CERSUDRAFT_71848 [Gelatoporia subvermispora B]
MGRMADPPGTGYTDGGIRIGRATTDKATTLRGSQVPVVERFLQWQQELEFFWLAAGRSLSGVQWQRELKWLDFLTAKGSAFEINEDARRVDEAHLVEVRLSSAIGYLETSQRARPRRGFVELEDGEDRRYITFANPMRLRLYYENGLNTFVLWDTCGSRTGGGWGPVMEAVGRPLVSPVEWKHSAAILFRWWLQPGARVDEGGRATLGRVAGPVGRQMAGGRWCTSPTLSVRFSLARAALRLCVGHYVPGLA